MSVRLLLSGSAEAAELESLESWLAGEPELAGRVRRLREPPRSGQMGTLTEALIVAVGAGGALTALATSLRAWFAHPRRSDIRLTLRRPDGTTLEIDAHRVSTAALAQILSATRAEDGGE